MPEHLFLHELIFKKPAGTVMTADMVADGIPAQRKVLFPA